MTKMRQVMIKSRKQGKVLCLSTAKNFMKKDQWYLLSSTNLTRQLKYRSFHLMKILRKMMTISKKLSIAKSMA